MNGKSYQRRWRAANKERVAEYNRRRRESRREYKRRWRLANPKRASASLRRWFKKNPGKRNEHRAAYLARKKKLTVPLSAVERQQLSAFYTVARLMTANTGVRHHVDHVKPLSKGGLHHPSNLQILTADQNMRKSSK